MSLDEAFHLMRHIYTMSQKRDIHDEILPAIRLIVAAYPEARPDLVEYWRATTYRPELDEPAKLIRVKVCHPIMVGLMRTCRREGY